MSKLSSFFGSRKKKLKKYYNQVKRRFKRGYFRKKKYIYYLEHCPLEEKTVLLESQHGRSLGGNIAAIARELCSNAAFADYRIVLSCVERQLESRRNFLDTHGMSRIELVNTAKREYFKVLATAKYLINDNTFLYVFIKRPEQVYLNTWHGTPLKTLGRSMEKDYGMIGNAQRNFLTADYLLYPNEFTMEHMGKDYMLENLGSSQVLLTGYPRNSAFLDQESRKQIRSACGFEDKEVFAYLPTWRGKVKDVTAEEQNERMVRNLSILDAGLKENQRVYVKLHPISSRQIDLTQFERVLPFPAEYETYEFLNATDGLITDYSSVFFDYAVSRQRIMLFVYDKEEYLESRGLYFPLDELPFPQAQSAEELLCLLRQPKNYDDTEFLQKFCAYDRPGVTQALLRRVFFGEKSSLIQERQIPDNGKKNVVIYAGGFNKNGITTSIINLLHRLDTEKFNYIILYKMADLKRHQESLRELPEQVAYLGFYNARSLSLKESLLYKLWANLHLMSFSRILPVLKHQMENERHRIFDGCRVDKVVQFNGYVNDMILLFGSMPCNRTIYAHNDMDQEIRTKGNVRRDILSYAYQKYDTVAVVTPDLVESTRKIAGYLKLEGLSGTANIVVCKNVINYERIERLGEREFAIDPRTYMNVDEERLREVLSDGTKKFITIGRFSQEKGHYRLMDAFERLWEKNPELTLIIVGGYGPLFAKTKERAARMKSGERIIVIKYLSNPYALLKCCDYFVLPSFYEGFGLVLAEADILGVRCFSTAVTGPKLFMEQYGGMLVESSEDGILSGMQACLDGKVPAHLKIDYARYNEEALEQFEALIP